jgi:hypothetical protein
VSAAVRARVAIVMTVFDGLDLTRACLDSLGATTEPFVFSGFSRAPRRRTHLAPSGIPATR